MAKSGIDKEAFEWVMNEMTVLKMVSHPNIIYLKEIIDPDIQEIEHKIYLVTEYCK